MNLTQRPIFQKAGKPTRNFGHMFKVAQLPCVICRRQPVEVHHCIHGRFSQRRAPDEKTIPLCFECHAELHAGKETWAEKYGPDYEYLPVVADMLAGELNW